jgi:hypothetical protein
MKWIAGALILAVLMINPALAGDLTVEDFDVKNTKALVDLCTAPIDDPLYPKAIHFCHGYLVGAYHYYAAVTKGPNASPFVCPPENRPSRNAIVQQFAAWAADHPEYWDELPVETEFRFLSEIWPCTE